MKFEATNFKFDREKWEIYAMMDNDVVVPLRGCYKRVCDACRDADSYVHGLKRCEYDSASINSFLVCKVCTREVCRVKKEK